MSHSSREGRGGGTGSRFSARGFCSPIQSLGRDRPPVADYLVAGCRRFFSKADRNTMSLIRLLPTSLTRRPSTARRSCRVVIFAFVIRRGSSKSASNKLDLFTSTRKLGICSVLRAREVTHHNHCHAFRTVQTLLICAVWFPSIGYLYIHTSSNFHKHEWRR